jgi:hypothetical protein
MDMSTNLPKGKGTRRVESLDAGMGRGGKTGNEVDEVGTA